MVTNRIVIAGLALAALLGVAPPAAAQLNGENLLGDMGVKSGTQPMPGLYVSNIFYRYSTETIRDHRGRRLVFDPSQPATQSINATVPLVLYVSRAKLFGGNVGMMAVLPIASGALEAPAFGFEEKASTGLSDAYIMPLQLGWTRRRADFIAGVALFTPNGRYDAEASDNLGKGMWSYELSAGSTVYLDRARSVSLAATVFWETHSDKKDTDGTRVGQILTLEGGVGKSFLGGGAHVGMAYYAQWKLTADRLGVDLPGDPSIPRHRVYGIGPDITIPIATRTKVLSFVNVRYLWETGARMKTEGSSLLITSAFPVPSIRR